MTAGHREMRLRCFGSPKRLGKPTGTGRLTLGERGQFGFLQRRPGGGRGRALGLRERGQHLRLADAGEIVLRRRLEPPRDVELQRLRQRIRVGHAVRFRPCP